MGKMRKYERSVIAHKAAKENTDFKTAWEEYREKKFITKNEKKEIIINNTPKNTMKKKQSHFDNKKQYFNMLSWFANWRETKRQEKELRSEMDSMVKQASEIAAGK